VTEKQQICNKGEYWCASQGMCLSNKLPCLAKIIS